MITSPKTDECFLNNVFRVGWRTDPLPGKKEQTWREIGKANLPLFIRSDILHDLFTVFYNRDAANRRFCLNYAKFFGANHAGVEDSRRSQTDFA